MVRQQTTSASRQESRSDAVRLPARGRSQSRTPWVRRLAPPETLESRCVLSSAYTASSIAAEAVAAPDTYYGGYLTVDGMYERLDQITAAYPTITELVDYGDSYSKTVGGVPVPGGYRVAGYDLLALRITNEAIAGPKPAFVLMANIHAREIATPEIALRFAEWLTRNYGRDADATWLVDEHEIWVLPTINPDGHWYVELGSQLSDDSLPWMWRKNGHAYSSAAWPPTQADHYGVDLNRNFDFHWGTVAEPADGRAQTYPGPEAASEPETQAVQQLLGSIFPDQRGPQDSDAASSATSGIFISLHQCGEFVLWPWWNTESPAPNGTELEAIGRKFASYNGYVAGIGASTLYYASGTADDWVYGTLGVPSYTFEMGVEFLPAYAVVDEQLWPENFGALLYAAKIARTPYATALGPDAKPVTIGRDDGSFTVTATIDDSGNGSEAVAAAEYYLDTPPWRSGAASHGLVAGDGSFDGQVEQVTATLSSHGLEPGRHVVYVRGQDAAGHWGPFSAGLLTIKPWQNPDDPLDVNGVDGVQVSDALVIVNSLNLQGSRILPAPTVGFSPPPFFDVTGDGWITPQDVLAVVNYLNARTTPTVMAGAGEAAPTPLVRTAVAAKPGLPTRSVAVDILMASVADNTPQRASVVAALGRSKVEWAAEAWAEVLWGLIGDWMVRDSFPSRDLAAVT